MKKIYITITVILFWAATSSAQNYSFSHSTATYTNLVSPNAISGSILWDDDIFAVPISFPFKFYGRTISTINVSDLGLFWDDGDTTFVFFAFGADLVDRGTSSPLSPITYLVSGSAGNRIQKIEFNNAGFYSGLTTDFVNYQIWLYENGSVLEVHNGPNNIPDPTDAFYPDSGPYVGPAKTNGAGDVVYSSTLLTGNAASPAVTSFSYPNIPALTTTPANGKVYRFAPTTTGISELANLNSLSVFPNPVKDHSTLRMDLNKALPLSISLVDANGRVIQNIFEGTANPGKLELPLDRTNIAAGIYFLSLSSGEDRTISKVVIQ